MQRYVTSLRSATFALNVGKEFGPVTLAKLFPGMPIATAIKILDHGENRLTFESSGVILVPDDLCEDDTDGAVNDNDGNRA